MSFTIKSSVARRTTFLPPRPYAMLMQLMYMRRLTALRSPQSFSELVLAKNLTDRNPLLPRTADKYEARSYVEERVGAKYLIPVYQIVRDADELDVADLEAPFVMKATHGYDMNLLVREGESFDGEELRAIASRWLKKDFYRIRKEWIYKDIQPKIIIEQFLGDGVTPPPDYKFYVFNGRVGLCQVDVDRFTCHTTNMFDRDWNRLETVSIYERSPETPTRPENLEELLHVAEALGAGLEFVRVDLYNVDGAIFFGEMTHFPGGGTLAFNPPELDLAIGELWRNGTSLPEKYLTPYEELRRSIEAPDGDIHIDLTPKIAQVRV